MIRNILFHREFTWNPGCDGAGIFSVSNSLLNKR